MCNILKLCYGYNIYFMHIVANMQHVEFMSFLIKVIILDFLNYFFRILRRRISLKIIFYYYKKKLCI